MKNKEAENNLEKVLQLLNKHPNFTEFKVTENWENQLKKIIKYLLFFISDMNLNNIQIENEQNKLEEIIKKISQKENKTRELKKEIESLKIKEEYTEKKHIEIEKNLSIILNYIKIKENINKYQEIFSLLQENTNLYKLIESQGSFFLESIKNIDSKIKELEDFIKNYINLSDNKNNNIYETID